jgi:hypothetical protein
MIELLAKAHNRWFYINLYTVYIYFPLPLQCVMPPPTLPSPLLQYVSQGTITTPLQPASKAVTTPLQLASKAVMTPAPLVSKASAMLPLAHLSPSIALQPAPKASIMPPPIITTPL